MNIEAKKIKNFCHETIKGHQKGYKVYFMKSSRMYTVVIHFTVTCRDVCMLGPLHRCFFIIMEKSRKRKLLQRKPSGCIDLVSD